ncbi:MAG: hypothetical protein R3A12_00510 [Ignavibacteria bacterium]
MSGIALTGIIRGYNAFVGQTFMRGTQITDANGTVFFDTVYPGWYPGRATHIHFKVRLNSFTYVTSQFCFPDSLNNIIYATPLIQAEDRILLLMQQTEYFIIQILSILS